MHKILHRFRDVWKVDFLATFCDSKKDDNKTTWGFWFLSSLFLAILISCGVVFALYGASEKILQGINEYVPDDAVVTMNGGLLDIQNVPQPFMKEITLNNGNYDDEFVIVIDTQTQSFDESVLDDYMGGIVVLKDKIVAKNATQKQERNFANYKDFSVSKEEIISFLHNKSQINTTIIWIAVIVGFFAFLWFAIVRLLLSLWWAFMLYILALIAGIEEKFGTLYFAVLNLYFIPSLIVLIIGFFGFQIPLLTTMLFITIFVVNLIWMKKQPEKPVITEDIKIALDKDVQEKPITETTKD
jgi:hypothetical protein